MDQFIGKYLSLQCGTLGTFQGRILEVSPSRLKLDKACCNGIPAEQVIEIGVNQIQSLELLDLPSTTPARLLASAPASSSHDQQVRVERPVPVRAPSGAEVRASPRKLEGKNLGKKEFRLRRDEEAFGSPIDHEILEDFDFEKNLALFDKKAILDEISASKPDLVRHAEKNNYRCNENVLERQTARFRQIVVARSDSIMEFVTDSGLIVPSISLTLRDQLLDLAAEIGLSVERQTELVGRAVAETGLHLLGGAHRLNPHNQHQCPCVAVLCGVHRAGLQAAVASRQLASHGVRIFMFVDDSSGLNNPYAGQMLKEQSLLRHSGVNIVSSVDELNATPVDLIILALADSTSSTKGRASTASRWAQSNRAPVMAVDPPKMGTSGVTAKCSVVAALPLALEPSNGQVYLCNIGIPNAVFKTAGIKYLSPFGPKFVIPLHPHG